MDRAIVCISKRRKSNPHSSSKGSWRTMAHLNDDSFLSREQRLQLEHALSEKRKDEELSAMGSAQGHNNVQPSAKTKPSVLDIDPWESSAHLFLRRPSLEKGPPGRRASYEDKKAGAVAGLQLNKGRDNDGKPRRKSKGEKAWEPGLVPGETSHFLDEKDPNYNSEEDNECVYKVSLSPRSSSFASSSCLTSPSI